MIPIKSVKRFEALTLTSLEKNGLEFFYQFFSKSLSIFTPKNRGFLGGQTWAVGKPYHPANGPSKNIRGLLFEKIEYSINLSKKWFFPYYEMEQNCNFIVKMKSLITQRFLNQSGWDLVWVNIYLRSINTPNLILIGWETAEFWGLDRLTRRERPFKWGLKNECFEVWRPHFLS